MSNLRRPQNRPPVIIDAFDAAAGYFAFRVTDVATEPHAHPLHERIRSDAGAFRYAIGDVEREGRDVIIPAGAVHRVVGAGAVLSIEMWEVGHAGAPILLGDDRVRRGLAFLRDQTNADGGASFLRAGLAAAMHLSESHATAVFRKAVGVSPLAYLRYRRLLSAVSEVLSGVRLRDAALGAGFHDAAHFTRAFRACFGTAPSWGYNRHTVQVPRGA